MRGLVTSRRRKSRWRVRKRELDQRGPTMLHRCWSFGLMALVLSVPIGVAAEKDPTLETLKRFFPDRDLDGCAIKVASPGNGYYLVGESFLVLKDGRVETSKGSLVKMISP